MDTSAPASLGSSSPQVNFVFLFNIVRILMTKLRASTTSETIQYRYDATHRKSLNSKWEEWMRNDIMSAAGVWPLLCTTEFLKGGVQVDITMTTIYPLWDHR